MTLNIEKTCIKDLLVITPPVYSDQRGWFLETWQKQKYLDIGINQNFVQDNMSFSKQGTLRGLHMQTPGQGKLIQVIQGIIFDVAVDLRFDSTTFGKWYGIVLSDENKKQFWIPEGFAHGFYVLSETAIFSYKCTEYYNPKGEISIVWNDSIINIDWPFSYKPILSEKDANAQSFSFF